MAEAELVRVKRQNAQLRAELQAVTGIGGLIPSAYSEAITFAEFCAIGRPVTDEPGRGHAASQPPPPRNPAACSVLRREQSFLENRARDLRSATERAVERPEAALASPRLTDATWGPVAMAVNQIRADRLDVEDRHALLGVCARHAITEGSHQARAPPTRPLSQPSPPQRR